jgi:hypothetical protein
VNDCELQAALLTARARSTLSHPFECARKQNYRGIDVRKSNLSRAVIGKAGFRGTPETA